MKKSNYVIYVVIGIIAIVIVVMVLKSNKSCSVEFNPKGGSLVGVQSVKCGEKIKRPDDPYIDGYTFVDWVDHDTQKPFDFDKPITKSVKIDALYK